MPAPVRLDSFQYEGKEWTVDLRLKEFRYMKLGETPLFVPFESENGQKMMKSYAQLVGLK